ncbi:histidine kinase [Halorubrum sp. Ib24]|uniref:sensor domain-containing protein n=1 Tax=Halorubrum sp. Ib24 TaxID=1383850 RepID=UPI000B9928B8|nr:sensor domain-containing protein [Halorubrum sp. Ib24]OYR43175.1 histidine kinase [Halorubrum sp. Ib24]
MVSLRHPSELPVVGVVADGRTYRHLLYLLLAVPLGLVYSAVFTFGVAFGLALSVALVGLVVLFATLIGARLAAGLERRLANALLGTHLLRPDDLAAADGALAGARKYVDAPSTWRGLGFLSLKFWVSLLAFVPLVLLASALPLVAAPLRYPYTADFGEVNGEPVTWAIDTLPEALVALPLGVAGVLLALHLANLAAYVARRMALALLGRPEPSEPLPAVSVSGDEGGSDSANGDGDEGGDGDTDDDGDTGGHGTAGNGDTGGHGTAGNGDTGGDEADASGDFDFVDDPAPADRDGDAR